MSIRLKSTTNFWFSGHETFPLRVAWLPKVVAALARGGDPFVDPREGMRVLGLGKNMVAALECWSEYFGVVCRGDAERKITEFGEIVLGKDGKDPFLEDRRTLWLLHWQASTNVTRPFFAWHWLVNLFQEPEFVFSDALNAFKSESDTQQRPLSDVTLKQHLDVFLRTYVASEGGSGQMAEDLLDSPLASLGFMRKLGERRCEGGRDALYSIDVRRKSSIPNSLFKFCLHDWWNRFVGDEQTVQFSDVAFSQCSPGRVFRMPEAEIRDRLVSLSQACPKEFKVLEGANQRMVQRLKRVSDLKVLLADAYKRSC